MKDRNNSTTPYQKSNMILEDSDDSCEDLTVRLIDDDTKMTMTVNDSGN